MTSRRGTGGDAHSLRGSQPFPAYVVRTVNQMGDSALGLGDFPQTVGVGAVAGTHHQKHLALARELLRRVLTVLVA